ncbi:MAG: GDP-mannose 4,6-dehydratase [Arcobacteraceae bacterium]
MRKKILITAINSFTGIHLKTELEKAGYDVRGTTSKTCDITKKDDIKKVLKDIQPDYIIHLAGISYAAHGVDTDFYSVNTIGTLNLLDAIVELKLNPKKILLASSATVYGNQGLEVLDESLCCTPANHYGASKYAMETLARNYFDKLPIIITRPFNYTGVGQADHFLIPKIVSHYKENKKTIELGNLHVSREFNDIAYICEIYKRLLQSDCKSEVVNLSSNTAIKLLDIIEMMNKIAKYTIKVEVNPAFVRKDDIASLSGSTTKLFSLIGEIPQKEFSLLLQTIYKA